LIAGGELLAALGEITLEDDKGKATEYSSCDVWRFENGRMAELTGAVIALGPVNTIAVIGTKCRQERWN
jgi:hypothetical protein